MKRFSFVGRLRDGWNAWRAADPAQARRLAAVGRFFAAMLVLTLAARGVAGASMPRVTVGQAAGGSITRSATAAGTIGARQGAPMTVPEGLLVSGTLAAVGQTLHAGDPVAAFDSAGLAQALAEQQAQVRQLEVTCAQQQKGENADGFALQQAQEQLDRAYAEVHETWQEGQADVEKARAAVDEARRRYNDLNGQSAATPESAEAERQQELAAAEAELEAAEAALEQAQKTADANNEAAANAAQSQEDARNSAAHSYARAAEDAADATAAGQAQAGVTAAQLNAARIRLEALQALADNGGVLAAPRDGILTQLDLTPGQDSTPVAGLLAEAGAPRTLEFALDEEAAKLAAVGTQVTVNQNGRSVQAVIAALTPREDGGMDAALPLQAGDWAEGGATVELKLNAGQYAQCLPATAIQQDENGTFVYLVEPRSTLLGQQNVLVRLGVTVLAQGDGMAAVAESLTGPVVTGADKPLAAGDWVRVDA